MVECVHVCPPGIPLCSGRHSAHLAKGAAESMVRFSSPSHVGKPGRLVSCQPLPWDISPGVRTVRDGDLRWALPRPRHQLGGLLFLVCGGPDSWSEHDAHPVFPIPSIPLSWQGVDFPLNMREPHAGGRTRRKNVARKSPKWHRGGRAFSSCRNAAVSTGTNLDDNG